MSILDLELVRVLLQNLTHLHPDGLGLLDLGAELAEGQRRLTLQVRVQGADVRGLVTCSNSAEQYIIVQYRSESD